MPRHWQYLLVPLLSLLVPAQAQNSRLQGYIDQGLHNNQGLKQLQST